MATGNIKRPTEPGIRQITPSREIQGSPWGGGGFVDYGGLAGSIVQDHLDFKQQQDDYEAAVA